LISALGLHAQFSPTISSWLINTTGIRARHYAQGNPVPISDPDSANVQTVLYSANWVYVRTTGLPAYITGPFQFNPTIAQNQRAIFKISRNPERNTGTPTPTSMGIMGVFINGVSLFNYGDGVSWKNSSGAIAGGPIPGGPGDGVWNRDAVPAERTGFDCAKGHPAIGNYHHHQNPSAFNLDLNVLSTICNVYAADGLYTLDSTRHSPLIGFAHDGYPIYGAYGYKNTDGTGGIVRMKSSFTLRNITQRNTLYTGQSVTPGPAVSATYPLGYFKEDYQYNPTSAATPDYLDVHNGRYCITPEYPGGTYCYFATVDANWNSAYPYLIGETFYGVRKTVKVTAINEPVTLYNPVPLPVSLLQFTAFRENGGNMLRWSTAAERGTDRYIIEKSENGSSFADIGSVAAARNSSSVRQYAFTDYQAAATVNYYRLRIIDIDGRVSSSPVAVVGSKNTGFAYKIYPNPVDDLLLIQHNGILRQNARVVLTAMNGQVVARKDFFQGSSVCFIETSTLYEGQYVLTIENNGVRESYPVMIRR
jgi:hypothetical protein